VRLFTRHKTLSLFAALTALTVLGSMGADAKSTARPTGPTLVHRDGKQVAGNDPKVLTYSIGDHALEPTLGISPGGDIFFAAGDFDNPNADAADRAVGAPMTDILKSSDGGATWENVNPRVLGADEHPVSLDPYVFVDDRLDGDSARIYTIDLTLACSYLSYSDDEGKTWTTNPLSCSRPVNDHQTLFSGPPVSSTTVGYPNVLYYCWNDVGSSSCAKSLDGGITFINTGAPAFTGYKPGSDETGFYGVDGFCGGLHGHGAVGEDGTLYLPREYCGEPFLSISKDEGLTWTNVKVSDIRSTSQPETGTGHPSVAVDAKGNIYYTWVGAKDRLLYLSVSKDGGKKWSKPVVASVPGMKETNIPQIDVKGVGKVAIVYYGSANSPFQKCKMECDAKDYAPVTWNAYLSVSADALSADPTFYSGTINDPKDPLIRARCGPGRCHWAYDFIDVEIGPDGIAYGAFVDGCIPSKDPAKPGCDEIRPREGDYEGLVAKLVGAPNLR
jgi:hypothetical protein